MEHHFASFLDKIIDNHFNSAKLYVAFRKTHKINMNMYNNIDIWNNKVGLGNLFPAPSWYNRIMAN